jgi:NAD kinase
LVLPATLPIHIRLASPSEMFVTLDGTKGRPLELGEDVYIRTAKHRTLLIRNPAVDPFVVLREKLRWGAR